MYKQRNTERNNVRYLSHGQNQIILIIELFVLKWFE